MLFSEFTKEQTLIQHEIRKFTKTIIEPIERDLDEGKADFGEVYQKVAELGFAGSLVAEQFGGAELDRLSFCVMLEETARSCASLSLVLLVNNGLNAVFISKSRHKDRHILLKEIAEGVTGGFAVLPGFDENLPKIRADADKIIVDSQAEQFALNGNDPGFLLMPVTQSGKVSIYLVRSSSKIRYVPIPTLGMNVAGICRIEIAGLELVADQELIRFESKNEYDKMLNVFRVGQAAIALGIAGAAYDTAFKYAQERKQFGRAIIEFPMVQEMLMNMKIRTEAGRCLLYGAVKAPEPDPGLCLMARLFNTETAVYCGTRSVQVMGGYGYIKDYSSERYLRDAKTLQLLLESPFAVRDMLMKELL